MSVLDLIIASNNLALKSDWRTIDDALGSDHLPVLTTLNEHIEVENDARKKWNIDKADWSLFKKLCQENTNNIVADQYKTIEQMN